MIKISTLLAAAILALNATVAMANPAPQMIEYDGVRYTYTVEQTGEGRIIRGTSEKGNKPFTLVVTKRSVTGSVNGNPVDFSLRSVKRLRGIVEVAAR